MLHFILSVLSGILKLIGILLLTVLAVVLLVVLSVLFAPLRYQIRAAKTEERLDAAVQVSWLHVIRAQLRADGKQEPPVLLDIRIFGISPARLKAWLAERRKPHRKLRGTSGRSGGQQRSSGKRHGVSERSAGQQSVDQELRAETYIQSQPKEEEAYTQSQPETDPVDMQGHPETNQECAQSRPEEATAYEQERPADAEQGPSEEAGNPEPDESEAQTQKSGSVVARILEKFRRLLYKIRTFCDTIKSRAESIRTIGKRLKRAAENLHQKLQRAADIPERIGLLLDFVEDYRIKELLSEVSTELSGLWKHCRPRRMKGYLWFGTGDPAQTGELTGIFYLLLPASSDLQVEPDFNEAMLQTELELSGHIRTCHLALLAWRMFRNRDLRRLLARIRKKGD